MSVALRVSGLADSLPPETWGRTFARVRSAHYSNAADLAADLANVWVETTATTISRIEGEQQVPTIRNRRIVATAALLLMRYHPAVLDLDVDELPPYVLDAILARITDPDGTVIDLTGEPYPPWDSNPEPADSRVVPLRRATPAVDRPLRRVA